MGRRHGGSQSYRTSPSGNFAKVAAEQAGARLAIEREARLNALRRQGSKLIGEGQEDGAGYEADKGDGRGHGGLNAGDGKKRGM